MLESSGDSIDLAGSRIKNSIMITDNDSFGWKLQINKIDNRSSRRETQGFLILSRAVKINAELVHDNISLLLSPCLNHSFVGVIVRREVEISTGERNGHTIMMRVAVAPETIISYYRFDPVSCECRRSRRSRLSIELILVIHSGTEPPFMIATGSSSLSPSLDCVTTRNFKAIREAPLIKIYDVRVKVFWGLCQYLFRSK